MPANLTTLTEWARATVQGLYDNSLSEAEWLAFFDSKVSPDAQFTFNGRDLTASQARLYWAESRHKFVSQKVDWQSITEVPKYSENPTRAGIVAGVYVNTGFYRNPENPSLPAFKSERTPHIYIESQDPDSDKDTRRLVRLAAVASEIPMPALEE